MKQTQLIHSCRIPIFDLSLTVPRILPSFLFFLFHFTTRAWFNFIYTLLHYFSFVFYIRNSPPTIILAFYIIYPPPHTLYNTSPLFSLPPVQAAHIYPHCPLAANTKTNWARTYPPFWSMLRYFWSPDRVATWYRQVFTDSWLFIQPSTYDLSMTCTV